MTQEQYLIMIGIRSVDFDFSDEQLFEQIDYFKESFKDGQSAYKSLLFLRDYDDFPSD